MTRAQENAINRVCAHECLQRELAEALEGLVAVADISLDYRPEFRAAISLAYSVLARTKEQS